MESCLEELDDDIFAEDFYPPFEEDTIYDDFEDYEQLGLADCLPEDFSGICKK